MYILGINAYHGDAAAAIIKDGKLIAAVEEERFNRVKHCAGFPPSRSLLPGNRGHRIEDVEHIGISRDPSAHLHKKVLFAADAPQVNWLGAGAVGRSVGERRAALDVIDDSETSPAQIRQPAANVEGNGKGPGIFRQVKDRLGNAAKVRDLKDAIAGALGVSPKTFARAVS